MALSKITYDTKVALDPQHGVANINKVSDSDMNEIKSVVNNAIDQIDTNATDISNIGAYSTTEVDTGKKWIDGKSIYRKCLTGTTPSGNSSSLIANVAKIISYNIVVKRSGVNQYHPLSTAMCNYDSSHASPLFLSSGGDILLYIANSSYQGQEYYGWVEYTKSSYGD